jgi:hypothetical protein
VINLLRCVLRLPGDTLDRVDELAAADECNPSQIIEAIRVALVKRGRKPR